MPKVSTRTGGRSATTGVIPGKYVLSVGDPGQTAPPGFTWMPLASLARLESGHTPSRRVADYWGGDIPWIGIRDATAGHGTTIYTTNESTNRLGIANSSARVLPAGTVCLSRTASVGYVVTMGVPMATSQDFVNWVCGSDLRSRYLSYIFRLEQESVRRFAHGTTHQTVYYPEAKAFYVCVPSTIEQDRILGVLGALDDKAEVDSRLARTAEDTAVAVIHLLSEGDQVSLSDLVEHRRIQIDPASLDNPAVAHYSIPSFDRDRLPELADPGQIRSAKFRISQEGVLLSKLNPATPRVWYVNPDRELPSVASTEFLVLHPSAAVSATEIWASCNYPDFLDSLASKVTGTSNSHQRVNPGDVLAAVIPDPRKLTEVQRALIRKCVSVADRTRREMRLLAELRDAILPGLMSGEIRVGDAEKIVEDVT